MNSPMTNDRRSGVWTIGANLFWDSGVHWLWRKNQYNPTFISWVVATTSFYLFKIPDFKTQSRLYSIKKWLTAIVYWLNAKNKSNTVREHLLPATWIFRSQQQLRYSVYNSRTFVSRMPSKEIIYSLYHGWRDISNAVHPGTHDCITMEGETHTR